MRVGIVAVNQIGVATELVNTLFMAFVGAIALAAALAFGLGGRETAGEIVRTWYSRMQQKSGQIARSADAMERRLAEKDRPVAENSSAYRDRPGQLNPNPSDRRHPSEGD